LVLQTRKFYRAVEVQEVNGSKARRLLN
jgi:hypothetical protein